MTGLLTFIYVLIFSISRIVSSRVYLEGIAFIMGFTFICVFSEGIITILVYKLICGVDMYSDILSVFFPQALVASVLSPALFSIFERLEVLLNVGKTR
jgi:hypothetical protein